MSNLINIQQISTLTNNELAVIQDLNSVLFFGIKTKLQFYNIDIKAINIVIGDSSNYILMLKCNNVDIYKCSISLNDKIQKKLLYKFIKQKRFNLVIFRDKEQEIIKIENKYKKNLKLAFNKPLLIVPNDSIENYSNEQLWNLAS